jgi:hypothetical protein
MTQLRRAHVTRRLLVTLALLLRLNAAEAARVLEDVERAVELTLDRLGLPAEAGGMLHFRDCPACGSSAHRLVKSTVYRAGGQTLPLHEFLSVAHSIAGQPHGGARTVAIVFLDVATGRVTRIELRE